MKKFLNLPDERRLELYKNVHEIIEKVTEGEHDILYSDIALAVYEQTIAETPSEYFIVGMHIGKILEQNLASQEIVHTIGTIVKKVKRAD